MSFTTSRIKQPVLWGSAAIALFTGYLAFRGSQQHPSQTPIQIQHKSSVIPGPLTNHLRGEKGYLTSKTYWPKPRIYPPQNGVSDQAHLQPETRLAEALKNLDRGAPDIVPFTEPGAFVFAQYTWDCMGSDSGMKTVEVRSGGNLLGYFSYPSETISPPVYEALVRDGGIIGYVAAISYNEDGQYWIHRTDGTMSNLWIQSFTIEEPADGTYIFEQGRLVALGRFREGDAAYILDSGNGGGEATRDESFLYLPVYGDPDTACSAYAHRRGYAGAPPAALKFIQLSSDMREPDSIHALLGKLPLNATDGPAMDFYQ